MSATPEIETVFRRSTAEVVGSLARWLGDLDLAEDAVQEAFVVALDHWPREGVPDNPAAWLTVTARRRALDRLRRDEVGRRKLVLLAGAGEPAADGSPGDDSLALLFACCHPLLSRESQVALTLRAVGGLTTAEIAAAFLVPEATMAARLTRAKATLRDRGVPVRVPDPDDWDQRLTEVLTVIYLIYNEGYLSSAAHSPHRHDLAGEAIRLARMLHALMPREPEVLGLLALLVLQDARARARFDGWGRIVLLRDQDRSLWDAAAIESGTGLLERALAMRRPGPYQVQAAVAALHSQAPSYDETDWPQIRALYDQLLAMTPTPVVRLNRAVATRHVDGPAAALAEVDALAQPLAGYRHFHATRAELLRALGHTEAARSADAQALELTRNPAERDLLTRRIEGSS